MCVSSGNFQPAWVPSAQHNPRAAHSQRGCSPSLPISAKRVLSRSSANPICPPTLSPKVTPSYTWEHRQGVLAPSFSRQHLAPKTTSRPIVRSLVQPKRQICGHMCKTLQLLFKPLVTRGQRDKQQDEPVGWTHCLQKAAEAKGVPGSAQGMFVCLVSRLLASGLQLSFESREWGAL